MAEPNEAEQELREKIAEILYQHLPAVNRRLLACDELAKIIITGIREAGYKSPEELDAWAKASGYVKLVDIHKIMKEAPDLRSLERELADYLGGR